MLGMKLLQAATESGYPQSWACLIRHADSLCCSALFKPSSSRHTVVVTITPNLAWACCRDASIIKRNQPDLYGRRVFDCVSTVSLSTNRKEEILYTLILAQPGEVMWSSIPAFSQKLWQYFDGDDECNVLIRSILLRTWTMSKVKKREPLHFLVF